MKRLIILCSFVLALRAATTTTWEMSTYQDFIKGRFNGVSLDRDGRLTLAPKLESVFASGQAVIWSVAKAPDGSIYAGTGHRGRVYRIAPNGTSTLVWTADQPEVFAAAVDNAGTLYVATSPDGRIYRMEGDKAIEVFNPKSKYIWSLAFANDGTLYAGTGDPANVYAIDKAGNGWLYYSTGQGHVTSLAIDSQGRLLAGSEPNGIIYRISEKDKAFVLYDANLPEIRSIRPMPDGTVYAAALGGALSNRGGASTPYSTTIPGITVTAPATSITVTDTQANPPEVKPKPDPRAAAAQAAAQQAVTAVAPTVEIAGIDKSAIYKINPDNTVETLWSSKDENIYDLVLRPNGDILFGTDVQARIYKLTADRKPALLAQANEGEATRLLDGGGGSVLAATGETGKLYRLTLPEGAEQGAAAGTYESPVHDANTVARWGRISWRQRGGNAAFQTRTGNSIRPDQTWSDWSAANRDSKNSSIQSPNARYIQWRAELSGPAAAVENVTIAYLPQNNPPVVRSISVQTVPASGVSQSAPKTASSSSAYTVTVTDTGESAPSSSGTPTQAVSRNQGSQLQVSWQADDPDGDRLAYSLWFRGEDEQAWKLIRMNMFENAFLIDGDALADGRYYFRVIATDRPSNPVSQSRDAELVSSPVLIDNTPPMVTLSPARRGGNHVEVDVDAVDATSPLRRCEYSVDAGPWTPIEAVDGVTDSQREQFRIVLENMRPGEHLIVVRVYDTANNAGLAKVVVR
jgi:hypothetical protein